MKIEPLIIESFRILELPSLDPILVSIEDIEPGKGSILIRCYGEVWTAYWGAMGNCNVRTFFKSCDDHYLLGCLQNGRLTKAKQAYLTRIIQAVREAL